MLADRFELSLLQGLLEAREGKLRDCPYRLSAGSDLMPDDLAAASWLAGFLWELAHHRPLPGFSEFFGAWMDFLEAPTDNRLATAKRLKAALRKVI